LARGRLFDHKHNNCAPNLSRAFLPKNGLRSKAAEPDRKWFGYSRAWARNCGGNSNAPRVPSGSFSRQDWGCSERGSAFPDLLAIRRSGRCGCGESVQFPLIGRISQLGGEFTGWATILYGHVRGTCGPWIRERDDGLLSEFWAFVLNSERQILLPPPK
jgi:hypothetical protein